MKVSYVQRCYKTETEPIGLDEVFNLIKTGGKELKEKITQIRNRYETEKAMTGSAEKAREAIKDLKVQLPGFLPSGLFSERANDKLVEYSGLLCADLDSIGEDLPKIRDFLKSSRYVHAIALSPSGDGLKIFFDVTPDPSRHYDSFRSIRQFVLEWTGVEIDDCKDLARICYLTYDPDLWLREEDNEVIQPAEPIQKKSAFKFDNNQQDLSLRERIASARLGGLEWFAEKGGYLCRCPGIDSHTSVNGRKDCIVYLTDGANGHGPTIKCVHTSCLAIREAFNFQLRSEIGKAEREEKSRRTRTEQEEPEINWDDTFTKGIVTVGELHKLEIKPRKRLLGNWFCEGDLGFVFAFRGTGKTWLALALGSALSIGGRLGNWQAKEAVKVLYIDGEMPPDLMRERLAGLGATSNNLEILNHEILFDRTDRTINITNQEVQEAITTHCLDKEIRVLILDNLSTLACGMSENEADSWELVNNWLLGLRKRRIAVVIVHHAGRSGNMRGTSKREDNVFWVIGLQDMKEDSEEKRGVRFVSRFTKHSRNTQDEELPIEWHMVTEEGTGLVTIEHKFAQSLEVFKKVVESGVVKPIEIAKVMGLPDYTVSRMGKKGIDAGWLRKASRGEYALVAGSCSEDEAK